MPPSPAPPLRLIRVVQSPLIYTPDTLNDTPAQNARNFTRHSRTETCNTLHDFSVLNARYLDDTPALNARYLGRIPVLKTRNFARDSICFIARMSELIRLIRTFYYDVRHAACE